MYSKNPIPQGSNLEKRIRANLYKIQESLGFFSEEDYYEIFGIEDIQDHDEVWYKIIDATDPTPEGRYAQWIYKNFLEGKIIVEDWEKIRENLELFEDLKKNRKIAKKDILRMTPSDLAKIVIPFMGKASSPFRIDSVGETIYEDKSLLIYRTQDAKTARRLARATNWCVRGTRFSKEYTKQGPLFFFYKKTKSKYEPDRLLHFESGQFMNVMDNPVSPSKKESKLIREILCGDEGTKVTKETLIFIKEYKIIETDDIKVYFALDLIVDGALKEEDLHMAKEIIQNPRIDFGPCDNFLVIPKGFFINHPELGPVPTGGVLTYSIPGEYLPTTKLVDTRTKCFHGISDYDGKHLCPVRVGPLEIIRCHACRRVIGGSEKEYCDKCEIRNERSDPKIKMEIYDFNEDRKFFRGTDDNIVQSLEEWEQERCSTLEDFLEMIEDDSEFYREIHNRYKNRKDLVLLNEDGDELERVYRCGPNIGKTFEEAYQECTEIITVKDDGQKEMESDAREYHAEQERLRYLHGYYDDDQW